MCKNFSRNETLNTYLRAQLIKPKLSRIHPDLMNENCGRWYLQEARQLCVANKPSYIGLFK